MRTRIQINKELVFFIVLLILGCYCFFYGLNTLQKEKNAIQMSDLCHEECISGQFVVGQINSYIGKNIINLGNGSYSGVCQIFFTGGREYNFYTIPIDDNLYIRVMISDKNTIENLEGFSQGNGNDVYFEGQIIESPIELNYQWYNGIKGFESKNNIISNYVIKEINMKEKVKMLYIGILFLIISFLQFVFMGGFSNVIFTENIIVKTPNLDIIKSYNKINELMIEKNYLTSLNKKLLDLKRGCLYRIPLLVIGISIVSINYYWEVKIIGIIIIITSMKGIMKYIFHSGNKYTDWVMGLFSNKSIAMEIKNCNDMIDRLENVIDKGK